MSASTVCYTTTYIILNMSNTRRASMPWQIPTTRRTWERAPKQRSVTPVGGDNTDWCDWMKMAYLYLLHNRWIKTFWLGSLTPIFTRSELTLCSHLGGCKMPFNVVKISVKEPVRIAFAFFKHIDVFFFVYKDIQCLSHIRCAWSFPTGTTQGGVEWKRYSGTVKTLVKRLYNATFTSRNRFTNMDTSWSRNW